MTNKENFIKLVSEQDNTILDQIKWRIANRSWLKRSQAIAIKILSRLDELKINQKDLAERIKVSPQLVNKWVRGKENLTLETIAKLEEALDIELIYIAGFRSFEDSKNQKVDIPDYITSFNIPIDIKNAPSEAKILSLNPSYSIWDNQYNNAI